MSANQRAGARIHQADASSSRSSRSASGLLQSPLTDSNRRPPPYHFGVSATGRNPRQRIWRGSAVSPPCTTGCHRLRPLGSIKRSIPCPGLRPCSVPSVAIGIAMLPGRRSAAMMVPQLDKAPDGQEGANMPQVDVDGLTINYDVQGEGEPLLLIPYTSADHACWAFQLPASTEHFSCIAIDLPGSGESDKPPGPYSTDGHADQVAAFLGAIGIEQAHVAGMSFGAAVGIHLAARHPRRVRSLSLHSGWHASDDYLKIVVEQWRTLASTLPTVADVVIQAIFPWCFTPDMYVERPEFVDTLGDVVRGRPAQS